MQSNTLCSHSIGHHPSYSVFRRFILQCMLIIGMLATIVACHPPQPSPAGVALSPTPIRPTGSPVATLILPTPLADKPTPLPNWQADWLQGIPCRAPCWEGITPGLTTVIEAAHILNHSKLTQHIEVYRPVTYWDDDLIVANWADRQESGGITIAYPQLPGIQRVSLIDLHFSATRYWQFREIIAAYGEPTHILVTSDYFNDPHNVQGTMLYSLDMIYLSHGFVVGVSANTNLPIISPELELDNRVRFFVPTIDGLRILAEGWDTIDILPWQGIHSFAWYCEQASKLPNKVCQ